MENENLDQGINNLSNSDQNNRNIPNLIIDNSIKNYLLETAKWGKFLAIVGFVICGIIALFALLFLLFGSTFFSKLNQSGDGSSILSITISIIYLLGAVLYYFPSKYLYDFSVFSKRSIHENNQESLNYAFYKLKSLYRFSGILFLILLIIYAIFIVIGILFFAFSKVNS